MLSGGRIERLPKGLALMRRGVAPVLVISDGNVPGWPEANRLCRGRGSFRTICFHPDPYSTRGEARGVARLASRRHWRTVVVVSSTYHVFRARKIFQRCLHARVEMVGARPSLARFVFGTALEWPKLLYALTLGRSC